MAEQEQEQIRQAGEAPSDRQYQPTNQDRDEEIVQVVYQSDQHGALVGVESTSLLSSSLSVGNFPPQAISPAGISNYDMHAALGHVEPSRAAGPVDAKECPALTNGGPATLIGSYHEQLSRAASTLPSVAEEPLAGNPIAELDSGVQGGGLQPDLANLPSADGNEDGVFLTECKENTDPTLSFASPLVADESATVDAQHQYHDIGPPSQQQQPPIYSTIRRTQSVRQNAQYQQDSSLEPVHQDQYTADLYLAHNHPLDDGTRLGSKHEVSKSLIDYTDESYLAVEAGQDGFVGGQRGFDQTDENEPATGANQEIGQILTRQRADGVEKGSFKNNFRKKLGLSISTNENDLTAYRQKLLEAPQDPNSVAPSAGQDPEHLGPLSSKFKRTHSVSFNVNSSRSNRHSVDIRNLPSYLTHKRASIVDVAKGAMSSLISSLGSGGASGGSGSGSLISASQRRESFKEEEPIFEDPIAPTLSLGQRVAMVRNSGAEFGTVGWIGQFPDVDDDWIVGVIFDNMIGDCDGSYNGVRYFYARENYAMFVPLSTLTKTDNYIGRPETGTMLSRMSVSLKPGQLISIQRSSIRLQHCFLNAPHQRVGHDVRAVSNRLHCQCHNCGPCAHLTKQGRINALPHFGAHHLPHKKKNSLAHAAVEMLAHHHHHFHEEEEHDEKDYEFGDNAAHACNFVRYSCCQQTGTRGHEFSRDCEMVRPELLDNLIHAPKAPHRRHSRPRRNTAGRRPNQPARNCQLPDREPRAALEGNLDVGVAPNLAPLELTQSTLERDTMTGTVKSADVEADQARNYEPDGGKTLDDKSDQSSYLSSHSSGAGSSRSGSPGPAADAPYNYYQYDTSTFRPTSGVYNTINSQVSYMDQQRFVYQRDSAALVHSSKRSGESSDDYDSSLLSEPWHGPTFSFKRVLRCLGCLRRGRDGGGRRRHRRKLSFRDRVLEYRRRQSTFVPSTLAKPQEDFASHGIVWPHSSGAARGGRRQNQRGEINSDYSSCSRSSCSSSRSNSPPNYHETAATFPMQTQDFAPAQQDVDPSRNIGTVALEHQQASANYQLKSGQTQSRAPDPAGARPQLQPQLDYGDYTFGDGYQSYEKHELSRDSALTDLCFTDSYKSVSSSDTLKHLVDQSVNEQVSLPQPLPAQVDDLISPLSSASTHRLDTADDRDSPNSGHYEISSPTASVVDQPESPEERALDEQEMMRRALGELSLKHDENLDQADP